MFSMENTDNALDNEKEKEKAFVTISLTNIQNFIFFQMLTIC